MIFFILFGFPLISWMYLNSGLSFHNQIKKELEPKGELNAFYIQWDSISAWNSDSLRGKTSLFLFGSQNEVEGFDQFQKTLIKRLGSRKDLSIVQFVDIGIPAEKTNPIMRSIAIDSFLMKKMIAKTFHIPDSLSRDPIVLVDSSLQVRRYYTMEDSNTFVKVFEHLAFLLPPIKKDKVLLKNN